jgi:hypothetical protein
VEGPWSGQTSMTRLQLGGGMRCHPEDLMKSDLFSEIVLLASGGLILVSLLVIVVTAITRG